MSFALPARESWCLYSPEALPRIELARWQQQAGTFFDAALTLAQTLSDPLGVLPACAAVEVDLRSSAGGDATRVRVLTLPLDEAPELLAVGREAVEAIGGAGFDALLARARRVWQVQARTVGPGDPRAPAVLAGVMASIFLAPIVPPGERVAFGVRGARLRLMDLDWPRVR